MECIFYKNIPLLHGLHSAPPNTKRCFDVDSTSFERYRRQMDVEATLCAYWAGMLYVQVVNHL